MVNTLYKVEPERPWWELSKNRDNWNYGELCENATALYDALVALRAESAWESRIESNASKPFFKSNAEVAADAALDQAVKR